LEVYFIRHGESESNAKVSESGDSVLTPLGHRQADAAGLALRGVGIERLYCSLQQRALQTAGYISRYTGLSPIAWLELCERGYSRHDNGLSRSEITRQYPGVALPDEADELGWARHWNQESEEELFQRMGRVADKLRTLALNGEIERIACVVHATSCSMLLRRILGVDASANTRFTHANCGITLIKFAEDRTFLRHLNDTRHMDDLQKEQPEEQAG
jgi:probable phosphoglycerate mutase